jgi:hypothetical protein
LILPLSTATLSSSPLNLASQPFCGMLQGFLFNYVTCANYTTEIWAWIGFNIATQSLLGWFFLLCGASQMTIWAIAKHKRLRKVKNNPFGTSFETTAVVGRQL